MSTVEPCWCIFILFHCDHFRLHFGNLFCFDVLSDIIGIWRSYTGKIWVARWNSLSECQTSCAMVVAAMGPGRKVIAHMIIADLWLIVSRRKLNAEQLAPDEVASLCACIVSGDKLSIYFKDLCVFVCMHAADPRVCPRAENAERNQKPENMFFWRAGQIHVKNTLSSLCPTTPSFPLSIKSSLFIQ